MVILPFTAEHFHAMKPQAAQMRAKPLWGDAQLRGLEQLPSYTVMNSGQVLMLFGHVAFHDQRALVWSILSEDAGGHMISVHRIGQRFVDSLPYRRIEMEVDCEFEQAHRWARMLGFSLEVPRLRCHREDGGDTSIYARIRQ